MPAKIRLKKVGRKGQPSYRVVVLDGRKPRDAKVVADLGPYDPKTNPPMFEIDGEAALKWLLDGAKPTRAARNILSNAGVMAAWDAAKRGETMAIEAKELKPDEPKKKPQPAAEEEVAETEPVEESSAEEAEVPVEESAEEAAEAEPEAEEVAEAKTEAEETVEEPAAVEVPAEEAADSAESDADEADADADSKSEELADESDDESEAAEAPEAEQAAEEPAAEETTEADESNEEPEAAEPEDPKKEATDS